MPSNVGADAITVLITVPVGCRLAPDVLPTENEADAAGGAAEPAPLTPPGPTPAVRA